jgi:hypothetical protein
MCDANWLKNKRHFLESKWPNTSTDNPQFVVEVFNATVNKNLRQLLCTQMFTTSKMFDNEGYH